MTSLSEQHLFYFHMTKSTSKTKGILTCTFFQQHQTGSFKLMSFHNKNFLLELHVKPENEVKVIPGLFTVIFFAGHGTETRQLFARCNELKRKKRAYHGVSESPETDEDSSSEDEALQCHPEGSI